MKTFKLLDFSISTGLIVFFTGWIIYSGEFNFLNEKLLTAYFITGGWQVLSMLVHALTKTFTYRTGRRYWYHWITFIAVITMPLGSVWVLVFTAPFMAVYYTWICYQEVFVKMQRPLSVLK